MTLHSRTRRVAEELRTVLSEILLLEAKDPRLNECMVTVSGVDVTKDLLQATVHVGVFGTEEQQRGVLAALTHGAPFFRKLIAQRVQLRAVPNLQFRLDRQAESAARIQQLLRSVERPASSADGESEAESAEES